MAVYRRTGQKLKGQLRRSRWRKTWQRGMGKSNDTRYNPRSRQQAQGDFSWGMQLGARSTAGSRQMPNTSLLLSSQWDPASSPAHTGSRYDSGCGSKRKKRKTYSILAHIVYTYAPSSCCNIVISLTKEWEKRRLCMSVTLHRWT